MLERVFEASRLAREACVSRARSNEDVGAEVMRERGGRVSGAGDAVLEPRGDARSLPEVGFSSSSMEIKRRVRGRSVETAGVELLLDEGEPLVGCMAFGRGAQLAG